MRKLVGELVKNERSHVTSGFHFYTASDDYFLDTDNIFGDMVANEGTANGSSSNAMHVFFFIMFEVLLEFLLLSIGSEMLFSSSVRCGPKRGFRVKNKLPRDQK
jgi:hypothetical protein